MSLLLRIFRRPDYQSDVTQLIELLKAAMPDLEARQRKGRAIWWDKHLDPQAQTDWQQAKVPQKPYVYGDDPRQRR
jgi:hypothetical protein